MQSFVFHQMPNMVAGGMNAMSRLDDITGSNEPSLGHFVGQGQLNPGSQSSDADQTASLSMFPEFYSFLPYQQLIGMSAASQGLQCSGIVKVNNCTLTLRQPRGGVVATPPVVFSLVSFSRIFFSQNVSI